MNAKMKEPLIDAMPGRHSGDVCFAGTRVPVSTLFECLAGGDSLSAFLVAFPSVSTEQVRFALREATAKIERDYGLPDQRMPEQQAMAPGR